MDVTNLESLKISNEPVCSFVSPDTPAKCPYTRQNPELSTHSKVDYKPRQKIMLNICEAIGHTPMVRVNNIKQKEGLQCEMLVKCEFMNPGGSVKDRIAYRMIIDAEKQGLLKLGKSVIIEPTSGNTGIGLAMAAAVRGYRCIIVMPQKMSDEKVNTLRCLGAEIVRTPTEAAFDSPEGLIQVAWRLQKEIPNAVVLDQYRNSGNPLAHYDLTAEEILDQCNGKVDMVVIGAGTGGTVTGIGRKIKEKLPNCKIVAVDPEGSILARPKEMNKSDVNFYEVEGIGYDFIPSVLDHNVVDSWIKLTDKDALPMARRLMREEGILCGGSSGTAMAGAIKAAKNLGPNDRCVVILPDGIRNYMSKFVSDNWMEARNLFETKDNPDFWWWKNKVSTMPLVAPQSILPTATCNEALSILKGGSFEQLSVIDTNGKFQGMVTMTNIVNRLVKEKLAGELPVQKALVKNFRKVTKVATLGHVSRILELEPFFVVVVEESTSGQEQVLGVIRNTGLLDHIRENEPLTQANGKTTEN